MMWGNIARLFKSAITGATAAIVISAIQASAWAVDVVNADNKPHNIVVNDSGGDSKSLTLAPKEKVAAVCVSCVIVFNDTTTEATGDMIVKIENGKASTHAK